MTVKPKLCEVRLLYSVSETPVLYIPFCCPYIAVRMIRAGCTHEHMIMDRLACMHCADRINSTEAMCFECLKAGHECMIKVLT